MKITKVVFSGKRNNNFICYADIIIDNAFAIKGLKLIRRDSKTIFIGMPTQKRIDGGYNDIAYPINATARQIVLDAISASWDNFGDHFIDKNNP